MKLRLTFLSLTLMVMLSTGRTMAQNSLAQDQNPNYMTSQRLYAKMADSINRWHGTTPQETYKAIDYMADKREARAQRKAFRRELRLARAMAGYDYYDDYNYNPGYYNYNPYGYQPYGYRNHWDNYFWNTLPLVTTLGLASWWWR